VVASGAISAEDIDSKQLIDQHYYAIASKATILRPADLNVPNDKFEAHFGEPWAAVLERGAALNAMDACGYFGVDAAGLNKIWLEAQAGGKLVKLGGGFYCAKLKDPSGSKAEVYVFNGFFMTMRAKFTTPGESIFYYSVQWDPKVLAWADFRGKVLGPTDPARAPAGSIRGAAFANWQALGLKAEPTTGDNAVHASASPFEGLAERTNWLGGGVKQDVFGSALLRAGVKEATIKAWSVDPSVPLDAVGTKGSIFDALEDMDATACLAKCKALAKLG